MSASAKDTRHQRIISELKTNGSASVTDLSESIGVTEVTIRRDLDYLEQSGAVRRFHGGAQLVTGSSYEPPIAVREKTQAVEKNVIAAAVATLIEDGTTIVLDGGSTGLAIARAIGDRAVTVCPLSLRVAWELSTSPTVRLLLPSGLVRVGELSVSGAETLDFLSAHYFDSYLMTASGFSLDGGFSEWNMEDAAVKRAAAASSRETIAVIDGSKYGTTCFVSLCDLDAPQTIVTTALAPEEHVELAAHARRLIVA